VLLVQLDMRDVRLDSAARVALRLRLLESAARVPGVSLASLQESVPFAEESSQPIYVTGDSTDRHGTFYLNAVSADYFRVMGTRILRGRPIDHTDLAGGPRVAVISESMAGALWPGQDPIGQCFRVGADTMPCTSVVGVAQNIHARAVDEPPDLFYYLPAAQWRPHEGGLFVRTHGEARAVQERVRRHLQQDMPGTSFVTVRPLADVVDATLRSWIVGATVFTAIGGLALLLAAVGLYSVIAYGVTQRRQELGVRLALGAGRARIVRQVVREGLSFALLGIAIGGGVAWGAGQWIGPLLFDQSARDPGVFLSVTVVLLAAAVAAGCVPALRAAGVDPRSALQAE
jgi:predicted permease